MKTNEHSYSIGFVRRGDRMVGEVAGATHIRLDEYGLSIALFRAIPARAVDLLRIALAVYAADRLARRGWRRQSAGSRVMHLEVAVVEPEFWRDEKVIGLLREVVELLGGDTWNLCFRSCQHDADYLSCGVGQRPRVCLYSGGLDSAAGLASQLRLCQEPTLAVTTWHQGRQKRRVLEQLRRLASHYAVDVQPIVVRTALARPPQPYEQELSQRCRSFLFAVLGGVVACAEYASEVEIHENGVGAINLPLMHGMATGARTTKSSHPHFLRLMSELVSRVTDRRIDFLLPHRNRTKAEIVHTLAEDGLGDLAESTVSCVHYPVRGKAKQCGCCPACIGRRQALLTAGVYEADGAYEHDLFGAARVVNAVSTEKLAHLKATLSQIDRLADLRSDPLPEWFLQYTLGTRVEDDEAALKDWVGVLLRYRAEWLDLIASGQLRDWKWASWLPISSAA